MELRYLLQLLREYRRLIVLSSAVGCLLALAASYVLPEKFEASTTVLIRPRKTVGGDQNGKSVLDYPVSFNIPVDTMSKTYATVMTSEAVASRVVDLLHIDTLQPPRDPRWWKRTFQVSRDYAKLAVVRSWEFVRFGRIEAKDPYREAVEKVKNGLKADPVSDTFLFSLTATNTDPELAARIANTAASVFIDYTRRARMDEEGTGVKDLRQRLDTVRTEMDTAREQLQDFGEGTTASSLDHELQLRLDELAKFESTRATVTQQLNAYNAELQTLRGQLAGQDASVKMSTTVTRNPVIGEIESALAKDQVEYAGLSKTLQPDHPKMRELQAQIDEAQKRLASVTQQVPDKDTSGLNETREQINMRLLDRVALRDAATAQLATLERTIGTYRERVQRLTEQKGDLSKLSLDLEVRENEYRLLSQEESQASLAAIQQLGEIRLLSPAVAPVYPAKPIKIFYAVAGLVFGFILSVFIVLVGDHIDPRVHDVEDLGSAVRVPVIAVVPHAAGVRSLSPGSGSILGLDPQDRVHRGRS